MYLSTKMTCVWVLKNCILLDPSLRKPRNLNLGGEGTEGKRQKF
jgi:hypothetical protein